MGNGNILEQWANNRGLSRRCSKLVYTNANGISLCDVHSTHADFYDVNERAIVLRLKDLLVFAQLCETKTRKELTFQDSLFI